MKRCHGGHNEFAFRVMEQQKGNRHSQRERKRPLLRQDPVHGRCGSHAKIEVYHQATRNQDTAIGHFTAALDVISYLLPSLQLEAPAACHPDRRR
ncbi:MAG TPA: hypothetical protein VF516_23460, partial [Kofleriaceae bacterium]